MYGIPDIEFAFQYMLPETIFFILFVCLFVSYLILTAVSFLVVFSCLFCTLNCFGAVLVCFVFYVLCETCSMENIFGKKIKYKGTVSSVYVLKSSVAP